MKACPVAPDPLLFMDVNAFASASMAFSSWNFTVSFVLASEAV